MTDWAHLYADRSKRMGASEIRELLKLLDQPDMISFAGGIPDPALFPADAFKHAFEDLFSDGGHQTALQYSVSEGYKPLRDWIAGQMAAIGVPCSAENIMITSGAQQALDYLGKLFLSAGDTALVGWPTYLGALQAFNAYEPAYQRLAPFANMSAQAYRETATAAGGAVKFAYTSADFANPTGETLSLDARNGILDLAGDLDIAVIEDAAYQSLRFDGEALPPLMALDIARCGDIEATRTIYCGSFSKTLSPGLRLGWVCAATPVIQKLVLIKQASDLNSSTLNQMVMAKVAMSCFEEQVTRIRNVYSERRDHMLAALERHMPAGVTWGRPEGGMFLWLQLPETMDAGALMEQSVASAKVAFVPGHAFFADGSGQNCMRLNFTSCGPDRIEEGIARLGRLIAERMPGAA
ncbi:PLP-dependent aminotransferase family protein [Roseibium polysiphoniae]|uniref:PLP-dependent aminotransferase family protein n=1 Tax=Roseibium polysiphoniae TaxID=2571221 RepID=A0A944CDS3_9HYPH|nr:PLP-dependent aminotransferase family protein [Roseibium polysiphoniae]MBS8261315.1 PLP-dependent aminotransferase family protein [Roseibium polysiphoniae]